MENERKEEDEGKEEEDGKEVEVEGEEKEVTVQINYLMCTSAIETECEKQRGRGDRKWVINSDLIDRRTELGQGI